MKASRNIPSSVADMRRSARDIILRPVITEKSMAENAYNKYTFYVDLKANKVEIRNAIQEIFEVTVTNVTTTRVPSKTRRRGRIIGHTPERKKAVVTLKQGDRIEVAGAPLFES